MKQLIFVDMNLPKGKACVQVAHASIHATHQSNIEDVECWLNGGGSKIVLGATKNQLLRMEKLRYPFKISAIHDAGRTVVEPGTLTAIGFPPLTCEEADIYSLGFNLL